MTLLKETSVEKTYSDKVIRLKDMEICWDSMGVTQDEWNQNWKFDKDNVYVINNSLWVFDDRFCKDGELVEQRIEIHPKLEDESEETHYWNLYDDYGIIYERFGLLTEGGNFEIVDRDSKLKVINLEKFKKIRNYYLKNLDKFSIDDINVSSFKEYYDR